MTFNLKNIDLRFKGTVSVISSDPLFNDDNAQFSMVPLKPYYDQNVEDTVVLMTRKSTVSISLRFLLVHRIKQKKCVQVTFVEKLHIEKISLKKQKH